MAHYLETARELGKLVESFLGEYVHDNCRNQAAMELGYIVNLAVRCCPRGVQHTVRENIVRTAVGKRCSVYMEPVEDKKTGNVFHKIVILPKGG